MGTFAAWQIATTEAEAARPQFIEKGHLLIGILSLEKVIALGPEEAGIDPQAWQALQAELSAAQEVLGWCGLDARDPLAATGASGAPAGELPAHRGDCPPKRGMQASVQPGGGACTVMRDYVAFFRFLPPCCSPCLDKPAWMRRIRSTM